MHSDGIHVEILRADEDGMMEKCLRCWKYSTECAYDKKHGCKNLLCNRCAQVVKIDFPNDPSFLNFIEERKVIYGR